MAQNYVTKRELLYDVLKCKKKDIPSNDFRAYSYDPFRPYRWVYNKLLVAESQNLPCGPIGVQPPSNIFPVIVKPIINLYGMGFHAYKIETWEDYQRDSQKILSLPGLFWTPFFIGTHRSVDILLKDGKFIWYTAFQGIIDHENLGQFDYWQTISRFRPSPFLKKWIRYHFAQYTGCLNIETIGNQIIECHLRMGDINHLEGKHELFQDIIRAYSGKKLQKKGSLIIPCPVYLIPVFLNFEEYRRAKPIANFKLVSICDEHEIKTVQIDPSPAKVTYPTSGIRVFLLTTHDLEKGKLCRSKLKKQMIF